jgi:hypothetical protein
MTSDPHALLDQIATKTFKPVENFGKQLTSDRSGFGFGFGFGSAGRSSRLRVAVDS